MDRADHRTESRPARWRALVAAAALAWPAQAWAQAGRPNLADSTLEELMTIVITTASGAREELDSAPAAVTVVTAREIRTRGYRSLLDVLRDRVRIGVDLLPADTPLPKPFTGPELGRMVREILDRL
jgi:outer membrane receptor for ferrienterochelin and colicin